MSQRALVSLAAAAAFIASTSLSSAADLPRKGPVAVPAPAPVFSWTGFYIGIHGGAGWGTIESTLIDTGGIGIGSFPLSSHNANGWLVGGTLGYNWQVNPWLVLGLEGDWTWTNFEGTAPCAVVISCRTELNWTADVTGRIGVVVDRALVYVKGGAASLVLLLNPRMEVER